MKVDQTSEDGGECGNEVICKVTSMYFDCTIDLRCEQCEEIFIVHHSEPGKCKNSDLTEGNVLHVYHSVSEGYGRARLSRLSSAMGSKEMTTYAFTRHANYSSLLTRERMDKQKVAPKKAKRKSRRGDKSTSGHDYQPGNF